MSVIHNLAINSDWLEQAIKFYLIGLSNIGAQTGRTINKEMIHRVTKNKLLLLSLMLLDFILKMQIVTFSQNHIIVIRFNVIIGNHEIELLNRLLTL